MKIYFAHPVTDYGTKRQADAAEAIFAHRKNFRVENPDQPKHQEGYFLGGMDYFKGVVEDCDGLAFMRFPDGSVGAGVAREIRWALVCNKPVYEVFGGTLHYVENMPTPVLSVDETRDTIRRLKEAA